MKRDKIKVGWSYSDYVRHEHRWKWIGWVCGRWQYFRDMFSWFNKLRHDFYPPK